MLREIGKAARQGLTGDIHPVNPGVTPFYQPVRDGLGRADDAAIIAHRRAQIAQPHHLAGIGLFDRGAEPL
ncbi:hypothetical protein [Paracoccus sp. IB05]|uniref:hypothetical protein n=1 Tax=Paracoccus sp. IB05 TaxID=2779367 RepID=UPI0018E7CAC6|nr:hypothetical protein [Paracoccus sp. IB05]MBJ2152178.1 hypothetical protein [Paracoccus sp. IB05]